MPLIQIPQPCYAALEKMKADLIKQKMKADQPTKTTFGECVCNLLQQAGKLPDPKITLITSEKDVSEGAHSSPCEPRTPGMCSKNRAGNPIPAPLFHLPGDNEVIK